MERVPMADLWPVARPVIGMVHLLPLPGAPLWQNSLKAVLERALDDVAALVDGGVDGLLVENYGDVPFHASRVGAETVAAMTRVVTEVCRAASIPVGVNVLRNDARAALAVAVGSGASFIRVNVHVGALLTDQGWIRGRAADTLRLRASLGARCAIFADVAVKHAIIPPELDVAAAARDTWHRGLADALIVSGPATGEAPATARLQLIRQAVPEAPVFLGSGITVSNAPELLPHSNGVIVGSALQAGSRAGGGVLPERVREFVEAARNTGH